MMRWWIWWICRYGYIGCTLDVCWMYDVCEYDDVGQNNNNIKMYNKQRNSNNAETYPTIPSKPTPTAHTPNPRKPTLVDPDPKQVYNPCRKDSEKYTFYQTYPHYEQDCDGGDSVDMDTYSGCPSIQNGMFQNMLGDLHEEIRLKSEAFAIADTIVKQQEATLKALMQQNNSLKQKLQVANRRIQNLQQQLTQKSHRFQQSTTKKSITKTYITQKNIPQEDHPQPLKLISAEIFNQFAQNYQALVNELSQWVCKEQEDELDNSVFDKLHMHRIEVEELLFGKCQDQYSKTTYETLMDNTASDDKRKPSPTSSYNEYEQTIDMYKDYCNKLSSQLCQSINYIMQLSKSLQKAHTVYSEMAKPQALLPTELMNLITKQCNKIINNKFAELKSENLELIQIIQEMIAWIQRNSKDGGHKFRSSFSAIY